MSGITVVSPNIEIEDQLRDRFVGRQIVRRVWSLSWPSPESAVAEIAAAQPDIVVLGPDVGDEDTGHLLRTIDRTHPHIGVIIVLSTADQERMIDYLRAGARDVIAASPVNEALIASVEALNELLEQRKTNVRTGAAGTRRVIAVLSPKGGTGKTTLATNLAVGLASRARNQTLLIDLDLQFGDAASALGLEPEYSLANAVAVPFLEPSSLKVFLDLHDTSLALLPPPDDFVQAESIDHDRLKNVVDALVNEFPYVVIDTAAGIDEASLLALEFATDLLFVTTPDVPSIRAVKRQLDALDRLGLMGQRRHFLLNRSDARVGLTKADIEATIGMPIILEIPSSRVVPVSTNQGVPLLAGEGRDAVTKAMQSMVDHFLPDSEQRASKSGRLFRRKES